MRQQFSLLVGPLARAVSPPQRIIAWGRAADRSIPDQPIVPQYQFRKGKFYQLQNRMVAPEIPADQSKPNAPVLRQYAFRVGGFWQTSKLLVGIDAVEPPLPPFPYTGDLPPYVQYVFHKGKLWQVTKQQGIDAVAPAPPPPPPPPPPVATGAVGGVPYRTVQHGLGLTADTWKQKIRLTKGDIMLLLMLGEIDEDEAQLLMAKAYDA